MPIPTARQNPYAQDPLYGQSYQGGQNTQQMNGHNDRAQVPNGYPAGQGHGRQNGRQNGQVYGAPNGMPQEGPSRGMNNNNHKSTYGAYGDPRYTPQGGSRESSRRPTPAPQGHYQEGNDPSPSRRPNSYMGPHPDHHQQSHTQQPRLNRFPVEHLYTFAMDKKDGVVSVEDGIRKLKLLDAKGRIWSQDVRLTITEKEVALQDEYTQETLEMFPLQDIGAISAELKQCHYDSLLVITVRYGNKRPSEMMMFQCEQIPAPEIARSLQRAVDYNTPGKKRKSRPESYGAPPISHPHPQGPHSQAQVHGDPGRGRYSPDDMYIPPPPDEPAPPPPSDDKIKNKVAAFAAAAAAAQANGSAISPRGFQSPKSTPVRPLDSDEPLELLAMRTERDVEVLNHCFDDIESFVGRLQKAAEAYTELKRRQRSRKNRRREHGDGLLLARSRPPTDGEYIECFQKFKYCFNLLAKLRPHIHDPNAPELVHFLFVPLKLIIESCQGPELGASVVSPLMSHQGIELLQNCLTSRQHEMWLSLGRAWTVPSTEWPKDRPVSRYVPRFRNGWVPRPIPEPHTNSEQFNTQVLVNNASVAAVAAAKARESPRRMSDRSNDQHDGPITNGPAFSASNGTGPNHNGPSFSDLNGHNGPNLPGPSHAPHHQRQVSNDSGPIGHSHGPPIHNTGNGYHQRQSSDSLTHSPRGSAMPTPPPPAPKPTVPHSPPAPVTAPKPSRRMATAIFDFVARNAKELTIMADEQLEILNDQRKWWEVRNSSGQSGYVPSTLLKATLPNTNSNYVPDPPTMAPPQPPMSSQYSAPPPPPPPPPADLGRSNSSQNMNGMNFEAQLQHTLKNRQSKKPVVQERAPSTNQHDDLHEELMKRVSNGAPRRNYRVPSRGSSSVNLTYDSSREDVTQWLEAKGFSQLTVHSLGILNGAQLFSLTKEELQQVCHDDGSRVYSQLMIQKAALQEAHNGSSELEAIMIQRKARSSDDGENLPPPDFEPISPPVFSPTGRI